MFVSMSSDISILVQLYDALVAGISRCWPDERMEQLPHVMLRFYY